MICPLIKRTKGKNISDYTLQDAYYDYKEKLPGSKLTYTEYINKNKELYTKMMELVLQGELVQLPYNLSLLGVFKHSKISTPTHNRLRLNYALSRKYNKKIYHLNEHRNGANYRLKWPGNKPVTNANYYNFIPVRKYKRKLSYILQHIPQQDYFEDVNRKKSIK